MLSMSTVTIIVLTKLVLVLGPILLLVAVNRRHPPKNRRRRYLRFVIIGFLQGAVIWGAFAFSEWPSNPDDAELVVATLAVLLMGSLFAGVYWLVAFLSRRSV